MRKKKITTKVLALMMAGVICGMTACGNKNESATSSTANNVEASTEEETYETPVKQDEPKKETENPGNWAGVRGEAFVKNTDGDHIRVFIQYPTLIPTYADNWTYQKDPSLVKVGAYNNLFDETVDNFEEAFPTYIERAQKDLEDYRGRKFKEVNLKIETEEATNVQDFPAYKYTGVHTYVKDDQSYELPFVAYCIDLTGLDIGDNVYMYWIVIDDSVNYQDTMEPLPEGMIDLYAEKMAESIKVDQMTLDDYNRRKGQ